MHWIQIGSGYTFSCALGSQRTATCWGSEGSDYEFGQDDAPDTLFKSISVGTNHICGIRETGAVECWGQDYSGQSSPPDLTLVLE